MSSNHSHTMAQTCITKQHALHRGRKRRKIIMIIIIIAIKIKNNDKWQAFAY
jgi:hypothetical protein